MEFNLYDFWSRSPGFRKIKNRLNKLLDFIFTTFPSFAFEPWWVALQLGPTPDSKTFCFCCSQCHVELSTSVLVLLILPRCSTGISLCRCRPGLQNVSKLFWTRQGKEQGFTDLPHQSSVYSTPQVTTTSLLPLLFSASLCPSSLTDNCVYWWASFVISCFCHKVKPDMILFAIASVFDASCNSIKPFPLFRTFRSFSSISVHVSCQHLIFFFFFIKGLGLDLSCSFLQFWGFILLPWIFR